MAKGREHILEDARKEYGNLIGRVADEMRGWYDFTEQARKNDAERKARWKRDRAKRERQREIDRQPEEHDDFVPAGTIVNEKTKTKPNQPCPCGSGKKYKKRCGR